jgi:TonB family protein
MMRARGVVQTVVALSLAGVAHAQVAAQWCDAGRWPSNSDGRLWNRTFRDIYEQLRVADPATAKSAEKRARKLLDTMLDTLVGEAHDAQMLGVTIYLLAVAEKRVGHLDDAAWHWQMARILAPELRAACDDFDDVVPFLRDHLTSRERWDRATKRDRCEALAGCSPPRACDVDLRKSPNGLVEVREKHKTKPTFPWAVRKAHLGGVPVIEAVIDRVGIVREPTVRQTSGNTELDVAAMDAVRQWRYHPALLCGTPISVFLTVRIAFPPS